MANTALENDPRPLSAPGGSATPSSGTDIGRVCCKLVINVSTALASFSITTLDGTSVALGAIPVGLWTFDCQFTKVTWSGGTMAGIAAFYRY